MEGPLEPSAGVGAKASENRAGTPILRGTLPSILVPAGCRAEGGTAGPGAAQLLLWGLSLGNGGFGLRTLWPLGHCVQGRVRPVGSLLPPPCCASHLRPRPSDLWASSGGAAQGPSPSLEAQGSRPQVTIPPVGRQALKKDPPHCPSRPSPDLTTCLQGWDAAHDLLHHPGHPPGHRLPAAGGTVVPQGSLQG